jgi:hypothetical protein
MSEKKKVGRPQAPINLAELEKLAGLHCTYEEIAGWFGVTKQTIINRMKSDADVRDTWERGVSKGKIALRRLQFRIAEQGNSNMAIHLGKHYLGQVERKFESTEDAQPLPWTD